MHRSLTRCTTCRLSVLEAFTSLAGISLSSSASRQPLRQPSLPQNRPLSNFPSLRQSLSESTSSIPSEPLPWYLQVDEPLPPTPISPILALQEIPPLPPNPPLILPSVLEHLSIEIGLDNLTLLDLRSIDPPPALGANLLMIIGTARSVKHLNVSADRFCRWARKEYKLRPYADGLLGRNELKLKLRRKARKMKLAQSVGNTMALRDADDGITTGWICVNMGPVDEAVVPAEDDEEGLDAIAATAEDEDPAGSEDVVEDEEDEYMNPPNDYVGFGSRTNAPRIVVQMFTEQKRLEMDLEGLWDARNTRRARKAHRANAAAESAVKMMAEEHGQNGEVEADEREKEVHEDATPGEKPTDPKDDEDVPTKIEKEVDDAEEREGMDESRPMGSIGAS